MLRRSHEQSALCQVRLSVEIVGRNEFRNRFSKGTELIYTGIICIIHLSEPPRFKADVFFTWSLDDDPCRQCTNGRLGLALQISIRQLFQRTSISTKGSQQNPSASKCEVRTASISITKSAVVETVEIRLVAKPSRV
jgi:hypothetical protein